jgi:hypothetical protein
MPQLGVARQAAAAAGFRIVRMAARTDDFQRAAGGWLAGGKCGQRQREDLTA